MTESVKEFLANLLEEGSDTTPVLGNCDDIVIQLKISESLKQSPHRSQALRNYLK